VRGEARISAVLRAAGATLVPMRERLFVGIPPAKGILGEFKTAVNAYLRGRGPTAPQHSLTDVIAFNRRNGRRAVRYGQDFLLKAQAMTAADERRAPALLAAYRAKAHRAIDTAMRRHHVDALLTSQIVAAMTATSAGHPHVTVPAGYSGTHPFGMIIVGRRWDEAKLIGYAYDFEQATLAHRSPATINPRFAAMCAA
jgi:amidase